MYLYTNHRFCVIAQEINGLWRISPSSTYTSGVPTLHMIPADDMDAPTGNVGGGPRIRSPRTMHDGSKRNEADGGNPVRLFSFTSIPPTLTRFCSHIPHAPGPVRVSWYGQMRGISVVSAHDMAGGGSRRRRMQGSSESRMRISSCSWTKVTAANTAILATCRELCISFVSYSPPGRGFLTGKIRQLDDLAPDDWRRHGPRFQGENLEQNLAIVRQLEALAHKKHCKPAQL